MPAKDYKVIRSPVVEDVELPEIHHHNDIDQPAISVGDLPVGTDHATLANVTIDQHHARDHASRHLSGGGDALILTVAEGAIGVTTYTQGDMLFASAAGTLSKLNKDTTATRYLSNTGASNNPAWALVNLANGVTGTLPIANGGTAATAATGSGNVVLASAPTITTLTTVGLLLTALSATGGAGFRLPHGAAPTSPVNGDIWSTTLGLFIRIDGITKTVTLT